MRKTLILVLATLAVAVVASAATPTSSSQGANATVSITSTGFQPENVRVRPGDTVTWKNNDTKPHSVISDTGVFSSQPIAPGQTYSFKFDIESSYGYHDGTNTSRTGAVHVLTNNVSIGLTRLRAVYRNPVRIFGSIPNGATGEAVTIQIRPYGKPPIMRTAVTESGAYELTYRPTIRTDVQATWNGTTSEASPTIGVRPLVIFRALNLNRNLFFVRVRAQRSYARKIVRINRQNSKGVWVTTRIVRLNRFGEKRFRGRFPAGGTTKAQAWVGQTPGYVPGFSVIKFVSR
jgi:plastocyanin